MESYCQSIEARDSDIRFTSSPIVNSELFLIKNNLGKIKIASDSSKQKESLAKKNVVYEYAISLKFLKNIGFGTPIEIKEEIILNPELNSHLFNGLRPVKDANYAISKIDIEDNLLSNDVSIIYQDSKERLWIGYKNNGFSCLNSSEITHYNDFVEFSTIEVTSIIEYNNEIWIGTDNSGLLKISKEGITNYNTNNGLISNRISDFCIDANNFLWISTSDAGIFRLNQDTFYSYNKLHTGISLKIPKIEFNKSDNKIWFYDENNNILSLDNSYNLNIVNYDDANLNKSIEDFECKTKVNILYSDNSLGTINNENIEVTKLNEENDISVFNTVYTANSGNVWIGGKNGNLTINFPGFSSSIKSREGLSNNIVSNIIQDPYDQIWLSTIGGGIFHISKSNFKTIFNNKDDYFTASPALTSNTSKLIFQGLNGIVEMDEKLNLKFYNHPNLKESNSIYSKGESIYIASSTGLYIIENDSLYQFKHPLKSQQSFNNNISVSAGIDSNSIFITNKHYGLYEFNLNTYSFETLDLKLSEELSSTYRDSSGRIWIANRSGKIQYIKNNKLYEGNITIPSIRSYIQDQQGQIWIITKKGAFYINSNLNNITQLRVNSPSVSNDIRSIAVNENGEILLGTQKNLVIIKDLKPHYYQTYTEDFGINGSSYTFNGMCSFKSDVFFSTNKGIVKYSAFEFAKKSSLKISLSDIKVNGLNYDGISDQTKGLVLSYGQNKLTISKDFEAFQVKILSNYWGNQDHLLYYYRQNKSKTWRGPVPKGNFIFNSFEEGENIIEFKAVAFGGVTSNILTLEVIVVVPFYRQPWFIVLIILVIVFGIFLVFKDRLSFNFKSLHSYSNFSTYVYKTRILSTLLLLLFPSFEYIFASVLELYTPEYMFLFALMTLVMVILLVSFSKRVSLKLLINFTTFNSIAILYFVCFRSFNTDYNFIFTMESMVIIAFIVFVMEDIKRYLIFLGFALTIVLFGIRGFDTGNVAQIMFVTGNLLLISFTVIYQVFRSIRTTHLNFSENVLNTYDKLVIVYNKNGEVVYFNKQVKLFFNCDDEELLGDNWYSVRGIKDTERIIIKKSITEQIITKQTIDFIEEELFSTETMSYQTVKWEFQTLDSQFLMAIGSDITTEKTQAKEIKQLSQIAESVFNGITRNDINGNLIWCNSSYEKITGYNFEELKGRRPSMVFKTPEFFKEEFTKLKNQKQDHINPFTVAHYHKNGNLMYLMINITPVYENGEIKEYIEIITDVTEQKIKEVDFKRLSLIAQHTQNPTLLISKEYELKWYNGAFVKEFGFAEEYLQDNSMRKLFKGPESDDSQFERFQTKINQGKKATEEILIYNVLEEPVWMQISMDPIHNDEGIIVEYICIMQNIQKIKDTQKLLESKNKDVLDSISYALRIQNAILPNLKLLKKTLPPYFMYYRPKDIVSGDFYFIEMEGSKLFIAIADCTGHGVPGAMMTSIGSSALNNAIIDKKINDPGEILEYVDLFLKNSLSTNAEELSDGMDLGLIAIDFKNETLEYCGAKRPLIYFSEDGTMNQIPGIKKSIGEFSFGDQYNYITTTIPLNEQLDIYCFSDGIPDQFGGARKKKIYVKKVLEHLAEHHNSPIDIQNTKFEDKMNDWTGNFKETEQTDDMVLFGARITTSYMSKMKRIFSFDE